VRRSNKDFSNEKLLSSLGGGKTIVVFSCGYAQGTNWKQKSQNNTWQIRLHFFPAGLWEFT